MNGSDKKDKFHVHLIVSAMYDNESETVKRWKRILRMWTGHTN